jgi:hypothetical protein
MSPTVIRFSRTLLRPGSRSSSDRPRDVAATARDCKAPGRGTDLARPLCLVVLLLGIALRLLQLDADPRYYMWIGYVPDEGRWVTHAREMALYGSLTQLDWFLHLLLAPLFQLAAYLSFETLGVSLLSARLFTALCGSALLLTLWAGLRSVVPPAALLVALALAAFDMDLLQLSRVAIPEIPVMFLELVIFLLLVSRPSSAARLVLAGFLALVMTGLKATALPVVGIFAAIIAFQPADSTGPADRVRRLAVFGAGFAAPLLLVTLLGALYLWRHHGLLISLAGILKPLLATVDASTAVYSLLSLSIEQPLARGLNVWALAVWVSVVGWMVTSRDDAEASRWRRYLVSAWIWIALYAGLMSVLVYFPPRYKVHIFVPMGVAAAVGIACLQNAGGAALDRLLQARGWRGLLTLTWLGLPAAVFASPVLAAGAALFADASRLRLRLACVACALALTVSVLRTQRSRPGVGMVLVALPLIAELAWLALQVASDTGFPFWPVEPVASHAARSLALVAGAAATAVLTARSALRWSSRRGAWLVAVAAVCYVVVCLVRIVPGYVEPQYSLKTTSRSLSTLLNGTTARIAAFRSEGLFNENAIPYASLGGRLSSPPPEFVVVALEPDVPWYAAISDALKRHYCLRHRYPIPVTPEYYRTYPETSPEARVADQEVRVYQRLPCSGHETVDRVGLLGRRP